MTDASGEQRKQSVWGVIALMVLGGVFGLAYIQWTKGSTGLPWADAQALFLGIAMVAVGLIIFFGSFSRATAARIAGTDIAEPASSAQVRYYRLQALVMMLGGITLTLPVLTFKLYDAPTEALRMSVAAVIAGMFALQTVLNLIVWRRADEFVRRIISETSVISFWVLQAALFLWAAGERLGLLSALSTWDCTVILMAAYLVIAAVVSTRNGVAV